MSSIPLPALDLRPVQQPEDPLSQYGKILQLKQMMAQQQFQPQMQAQQLQAAQQENQQRQLQIAQTKALNSAFSNSVTTDSTTGQPTFDRNKVYQSVAAAGQGSAVPGLTKTFNDLDEQAGKIQEAKDKHTAAAQDYIGTIAKAIKDANYDPTIAGTLLAHAASGPFSKEVQQIMQQIQQNPGALKQMTDSVLSQSPKQQELATAKETADARMAQAGKPTAESVLKDAANPDPAISGPAKAILAAQAQQTANVTNARVQAENSPEAIQGAAKKAGAEQSARVGAETSPRAIQGAQSRAEAEEKGREAGIAGATDSSGGTLVDSIGQGKMPLGRLSYVIARSPSLLQAVAAKYPDFDASKVQSYADTYKNYTSGKVSVQLNSGSTALRHLADLKAINQNPAARVYGTKAYNAYHNLLDTVADELSTFYGEPKTNEAIESKKATLGAWTNRDAAIQQQAQAMGEKFDELENTWKNAAPSKAYEAPMPAYSAAAKQARAYLDPNYKAATAQPEAQNGLRQPGMIYARDASGQLHQAKPGTPLPAGWKFESK